MSEFWNRCLEELRQRYAQEVFQNWFADLQADETGLESGSLTLIADSGAKARTLQTSYGAQIQTVINQTAGREIDITWEVSESEVKPAAAPFAAESAPAAVQTALQDTGLLPNLTFENIVEGKANQLAYAAAQQVANSTNAIYNPLFIYGGVGLGKTHLMQAIGHQYIKTHPGARVRCISAQQYINEFTDAVRGLNNNHPEKNADLREPLPKSRSSAYR